MIKINNHIHTEFDHDGLGDTGNFVKFAISKEMEKITFTIHSPCPREIKTLWWKDKIDKQI